MYTKFTTIVLFLIGSSILFNFALLDFGKNENVLPAQEGVAVIELFTSQGCSSCPSADRLLSQLINTAEAEGLPVYGLSFHVDYWNRLGWKDPYSDRAYTERQYAYARQMGKRGVYTPQMVVNGQAEFVGSDSRKASKEIETARNHTQKGTIEVTSLSLKGSKVHFEYNSELPSKNVWLNVALVERGISTQVRRGENGGRLLKHDNVVRSFTRTAIKTDDSLQIELPDDLNIENSSLILYSQDQSSWHITSATRVPLSQSADG